MLIYKEIELKFKFVLFDFFLNSFIMIHESILVIMTHLTHIGHVLARFTLKS